MRFFGFIVQFVLTAKIFKLLGNILPDTLLNYYAYICHLFLFAYLTTWIIQFTQDYFFTSTIEPKNKAVLITGCDSGFGHALAKRLDKKGFKVFACCLDQHSDGANSLKETCSNILEIIELNVTQDQSVKRALDAVKKTLGDFELWAVVNNAGVLKGFAFELTRIQDIEDVIQVNALGPVRVAKAFLPLLRKSGGRVVNLSSMAAKLFGKYLGPYNMSKAAAVAFNDVLMQEMRDFGVRVISVEPDFFRTQLSSKEYINNFLESAFQDLDEEIKAAYGDKYIKLATDAYKKLSMYSPGDIEVVLDTLESTITLQNPADTYQPCRNLIFTFFWFVGERSPKIFRELFMTALLFMAGETKPKTGVTRLSKFIAL